MSKKSRTQAQVCHMGFMGAARLWAHGPRPTGRQPKLVGGLAERGVTGGVGDMAQRGKLGEPDPKLGGALAGKN